jgi:hypothetical protein
MRITVSHKKPKPEVIRAVDRSIDDVFRALAIPPIELVDQHKSWNGSILTFSLTAKMGFLRNPVRGTIEVTDKDVIIDADLGMLNRLLPEERIRTTIEGQVRGLLT